MVRDLDGLKARLRALPVPQFYGTAELGAMALAATAGAYLFWTVATPAGALGDWRTDAPAEFDPARDLAALAQFDPFTRGATGEAASNVVTALPLKLFGTSLNTAAGTGSAIIEVEGVQSSFASGDEVMAGVMLKAVAFDHVVLARGGVDELLYVDQSAPAEPASAETAATPAASPPSGVTLDAIAASVRATPRIVDGQTTGLVLSSADPAQLAAVGLEEGDIVTRVNGAAVASIEELLERAATPRADGMAIFTIERAGRVETIRTRIAP